MKKAFIWVLLLILVFQPGSGALPSAAAQGNTPAEAANTTAQVAGPGGMPGWPQPDKPVPHNEPGHPSNAINYTSQVAVTNQMGAVEAVPLSGLDAMAADGIDPLAGNHTLVSQDQLLRGGYSNSQFNLETLTISDTISGIAGSQQNLGDFPSNALAAGDLNADGQSEQVVAWMGSQNQIFLSTGEMPGMPGKTSPAPAAVAHGSAPPDGYALEFNGANNYVDAGDQISLANASFTVAFWARRNAINRSDYVIGQGVGITNAGLHIGFRSNNKFTCAFFANDLDTAAYTDTAWHHWACTYDASTKLRTIYRDGVQVAQDTDVEKYQGSGNLYIGKASTTTPMLGLVDQVGIWSVARTQEQINLDRFRSAPDVTDLVAFWPFDEGSGTTATDVSGNGHDGTLVNTPIWNPENAPQGELGEIHLLVRGYDEALWHCNYDVDSGRCLNWEDAAGGLLLSAPAVASLGAGQFDVFAVGTDNQVYRQHWEGGWSGDWQQYGDWPAPAPSWIGPAPELPPPAAVARNGGIDLFRLGLDNTLFWHNGTDWQSLGGMLASGPGLVSLSANHMQVFARGFDEALWTITYNGGWGDWQRLVLAGMPEGVTMASAPTAVSPSAGQIDVYVRGSDSHLWTTHYDGSTWSNWSDSGGALSSAVGAALLEGQLYLFSQTSTGDLQVNSPGLGWNSLAGGLTSCCTTVDTGLKAIRRNLGEYKDFSLDIETGYFRGDGRSQIVMGYITGTNQANIALFGLPDGTDPDNTDAHGFTPELIHQVTLPHAVSYFRIASGDFLDSDGIDDIAVAYVNGNTYGVDILRFKRTERRLEVVIDPSPVTAHEFAGTLEVASGDFDYDSRDEIATIWVWKYDDWEVFKHCGTWHYVFMTRIYDVLELEPDSGEYSLNQYSPEVDVDNEVDPEGSLYSVSLALAAGDVDGDGKDEIVRTWPTGWGEPWNYCMVAHFKRSDYFRHKSQVIKLPTNANENTNAWDGDSDGVIDSPLWWDIANAGETHNSYGDRLVVGDFNRDMKGEIIWQVGDNTPAQNLFAYQYNPDDNKYEQFATKNQGWNWYPDLVTSAFTGESVRVGPPTYRVQNRVDTLISQINVPPSHRDLVKDAGGNYHLIASPSEPCTATAGTPDCTHAKYATKTFDESQQTIMTQHAYSVSAGMEYKGCAGGGLEGVLSLQACVTDSINYTHGGNFEKTTKEIASTTFTRSVIATDDDKLVYFGTPYGVWEYPVLNGLNGEAQGYITVVFPLITTTKYPNDADGYLACNEDWYAAEHQVNNIWSYDPISATPPFEDYDPSYDPIYHAGMSTGAALEITYDKTKEETDSNTFKHKVSASTTFESKAEAKIKVVDLEINFKASISGDYEYTSMNTDVIKRGTGTTFSLFLGPQPSTARFTTWASFYWAKDGYQALNYETEPTASSDWQYYNGIADPAFILPWYGFPDDPDPAKYTYEPPPCGADKRLFSPDVQAYPAIASVGETVEISATVRNFSNSAPTKPVMVRFYLGDPSQNVVIGQDTLNNLSRQSGPRTAHITWTASGSGKQRIYTVIDPDNEINPEVHDEDDLINNNVAYTPIEIGSAAFADMGSAEEQPYQGQTYSQEAGIQASFYMPTANLGAVTRFDLKDSQQQVSNVIGEPFDLVAYDGAGEKMWDEPSMGFNLASEGSAPAVITVAYSNASIAGHQEANLRLYQLTNSGWQEANLACGLNPDGLPYEVLRLPQDNLIAVPVCQTGTFVLSDKEPSLSLGIYLPLVSRR